MAVDPNEQEQSFNLPEPDQGQHMEIPNLPELPGLDVNTELASTTGLEQGQTGSPQFADPAAFSSSVGLPALPPMTDPATLGAMIADDGDLIEKAWVEKAKEIVGRTKGDPYTQNKEMNRMKADYMKKRYNKDIKLGED